MYDLGERENAPVPRQRRTTIPAWGNAPGTVTQQHKG